jgi:hypothetical protein
MHELTCSYRERDLARQAEWRRAQERFAGLEAWRREVAGRMAGVDFARRELLALLDLQVSVYCQDHAPRYVAEAWVPVYVAGADDPSGGERPCSTMKAAGAVQAGR